MGPEELAVEDQREEPWGDKPEAEEHDGEEPGGDGERVGERDGAHAGIVSEAEAGDNDA